MLLNARATHPLPSKWNAHLMQPPSILRTDNQPANFSDLLGLPAAPYFDFSYLPYPSFTTDNQPVNLSDLLGLPAAPYFDSHICHVSSLITVLTYVTISYFLS